MKYFPYIFKMNKGGMRKFELKVCVTRESLVEHLVIRGAI